jgi:hypothetical protein
MCHVLAPKQSYLGIQDAARKAHPCSQTTGAWAGAIAHIHNEKIREILAKWLARLLDAAPMLLHKELLSGQGFLVYITRTYPAMVPYLKGFYLTIEMWCSG